MQKRLKLTEGKTRRKSPLNAALRNPYAIIISCDASMDYKTRNPGGVGIQINFPDFVDLEGVEKYFGRYEGANIERLEIQGIIIGMKEVITFYEEKPEKFGGVGQIIITTDRLGLSDEYKTNPYDLQKWKSNDWKNFEEKPIKNHDLLDKLDKTRRKLGQVAKCGVRIYYRRRKYNKVADRLAEKGKRQPIADTSIALPGLKIGSRLYDGGEVNYSLLVVNTEYLVYIYLKQPIQDQWEISAEFCDGRLLGQKIKIYADSTLEGKLHRKNFYRVRITSVFTHHVRIDGDPQRVIKAR